MQTEKVCQYCGKKYYVAKSQENRSKFCSDKCFRANKNKQIEYNCDYCGKPFMITKSQVDKVETGLKRGLYCCSQCAKDVQKPKWGDICDLFESRGYLLLSSEYINAKTKLEYLCLKHADKGSQFIRYENLRHGYGCKYCGIERTTNSRKLSYDEAKTIFDHNDMILLDQPYINSHTPMQYICKHHPEIGIQYKMLANAYTQRCPYCDVPKGESAIKDFLLKLNQNFISHKTFDDLFGMGGGKLSYDFYLPELNLLIEYQGEQHERPIEVFGGIKQFQTQQEHDKRKREYANQHCMTLLEIWYYDFNNIEQILKQFIKVCA